MRFLKNKSLAFSLFLTVAIAFTLFFCLAVPVKTDAAAAYDATITFPLSRYPLTGAHMRDAIAAGHSSICTIDREGAAENRKEALRGIPTKPGYDRDEWPMAMCQEGGRGADVRYVPFSDNRGAGSWVGHQLTRYSNGTRIKFYIN
ncbi:sporulation protein [Paenibacillus sp. SYP-B3998]|uniref:Sporulation protein n=1 Tax=Paenibacillus sp. SYP-B3998 TaxID=2678564 RepID=A0A6G3ZX27_9BACL|nr:NucA/NucB deoxyribonuclease domain-containing protein [Paenibacillus sp. SYP-B3998]NEW05967.1 sporulation protein [Paenibacillus sp. SYP-B3998]